MSSQTLSTIMGSAPAWDNFVVPFDQLLNVTGSLVAMPANQLVQHLAQLSWETPIVMGAVLNDDPSNITILNLPHSYPHGVVAQVNLDGNIYAFVGGRFDDAVPVHIPAAGLGLVAVTSHHDPATLRTKLNTPANVTDGLRNPIAAAHANAQALAIRHAMVFPTQLAAVLQAQVVCSIPQF